MAKRLWLTIFLAVLIYGVGHMYLGLFKRGIIILVFGIVIAAAIPIFDPSSLQLDSNYWLYSLANMGCVQPIQKIESKATTNESLLKKEIFYLTFHYYSFF